MRSLSELFATLPRPSFDTGSNRRVFSVVPLEAADGYFVARSEADQPALIIEVSGASRSPIVLLNLAVKFNTPCVLSVGTMQRTSNATVIECLSADERLRRYFFTVAERLIQELGTKPQHEEVATAVDALVTLFRQLSRPPRRESQGLFGELVIVATADDPITLLDAWHSDPLDRFDFGFQHARLEVKTNSARRRAHEFSFEQCNPPPGTTATLASIFVETSGGGLSLEALILRVEARLSDRPMLVLKLHTVVAETLGQGLVSALAQRFDEELAFTSIAFYDLATMPAVRHPLPSEVSAIRFRSDLTTLAPLSVMAAAARIPGLGARPTEVAEHGLSS